jgi:hypothetical protein
MSIFDKVKTLVVGTVGTVTANLLLNQAKAYVEDKGKGFIVKLILDHCVPASLKEQLIKLADFPEQLRPIIMAFIMKMNDNSIKQEVAVYALGVLAHIIDDLTSILRDGIVELKKDDPDAINKVKAAQSEVANNVVVDPKSATLVNTLAKKENVTEEDLSNVSIDLGFEKL